jgi:hypothetical protein
MNQDFDIIIVTTVSQNQTMLLKRLRHQVHF